MMHAVKLTWVETGTSNAAMAGLDEVVEIEAGSVTEACRQAAEDAFDHRQTDWLTGRYDIVAECGETVYSVEFCD